MSSAAISPSHAWYVSMDGGRMFYGGTDQSFMGPGRYLDKGAVGVGQEREARFHVWLVTGDAS